MARLRLYSNDGSWTSSVTALALSKGLKNHDVGKKFSVVQKVAVCSVSSWSHLMTLGSFSRHIISAMLSRSSSTTIRARVEGGRGKLSRQLPCVR